MLCVGGNDISIYPFNFYGFSRDLHFCSCCVFIYILCFQETMVSMTFVLNFAHSKGAVCVNMFACAQTEDVSLCASMSRFV